MILSKKSWQNNDIIEFINYLDTIKNTPSKCRWEANLTKTCLPCFMIPTFTINNIVKQIHNGNFLQFLDHMPWENHSCTLIDGKLINKITDFDTFCFYLEKYSSKVDNWASCDVLRFNSSFDLASLADDYLNSKLTFKRRIGVLMLFNYINKDIDLVFNHVKKLYNESAFYVNMALSWLLCECVIKNKQTALEFLQSSAINPFVLKKCVSKCNDSYRLTQEDKLFIKNLLH